VRRWLTLCVSLGILSLNARVCQADEFTEKVLHKFRSQAPQLRAIAKSDDELQVTGRAGPLTVYLFSIRRACASNKNPCDAEVSSFVQGVVSVAASDQLASAFILEKFYPVLRKAGFAKQAVATVELSGHLANQAPMLAEQVKPLVVLPFVEGIEVVFFGVDGQHRYVKLDEMAAAGLTDKALLDLASRNVVRLPQMKYASIPDMPGLFVFPEADFLASARVFDPAFWKKLEAVAGGPVAIAVPTLTLILFTRADQPEQVAKLQTLAREALRNSVGEVYHFPLSAAVIARDGNSLKLLTAQ
jgi:uncharacterized protein YtpQ (UPF0354 family)